MSDQTATVEFDPGVLQSVDAVVRIAESLRAPGKNWEEDYHLARILARTAFEERSNLVEIRTRHGGTETEAAHSRLAETLLGSIGTAALLSREWTLAMPGCGPGERFWPGPDEAHADLLELCRLAREHFPAPGREADATPPATGEGG